VRSRAPAAEAGADRAAVAEAKARAECAARVRRLRALPALPGAPRLEAARAELLARARATPVVFERVPRAAPADAALSGLRREIASSPTPGYTFLTLYPKLAARPSVLGALVLREGYLYADTPALAYALSVSVHLRNLFAAKTLVIERGSQRRRAVRDAHGKYVWADGPERGRRATLLLFDRVWQEGHDPGPALALDVAELQRKLDFERMRLERITERGVLARLRYGGVWVESVLEARGPKLELGCELVPEGREAAVERARERAREMRHVLEREHAVIREEVREALPFDEPRTEHGQQDGHLRPEWRWAYLHGWDYFTFNDDTYAVFDAAGRPHPPEVCIDFITDTLERSSGTWWRARGGTRERIEGALDFDTLNVENRHSVENFIDFAKAHPEWFSVYEPPEDERVPFWDVAHFYASLQANRDRFQPGDVVAILGKRSDDKLHYHSFFVYAADPVTGVPMLLAGNAGHPRIRSWPEVMGSAPRRSIVARIRPRLGWLGPLLLGPASARARGPARAAAPI
jgi:hypothetical protein